MQRICGSDSDRIIATPGWSDQRRGPTDPTVSSDGVIKYCVLRYRCGRRGEGRGQNRVKTSLHGYELNKITPKVINKKDFRVLRGEEMIVLKTLYG